MAVAAVVAFLMYLVRMVLLTWFSPLGNGSGRLLRQCCIIVGVLALGSIGYIVISILSSFCVCVCVCVMHLNFPVCIGGQEELQRRGYFQPENFEFLMTTYM